MYPKLRIKTLAAALAVVVLLALMAGCAPKDNRITLEYAPRGKAGTCSGSVGVAAIVDARADKMLGHNQTVEFRPEGRGVDQWVRDALVAEFSARDCPAAPLGEGSFDYRVGGEVRQARLVADGMDHSLDLEVSLTLLQGERVVLKKNYAGHWDRRIFPASRERSEALMAAALEELLSPAVGELTAAMNP